MKIKSLFRKKPRENIIFLHLPKAGGTTLRHIFYSQYKQLKEEEIYTVNRTKEVQDFLNLDSNKKAKIKLLIGHFPFGIQEQLSGHFKYVTMLRNPEERIISAYNYVKSLKDHDLYPIVNQENYNIARYLNENNLGWLENGQTKFLAGVEDFEAPCSDEIYNKAINNIENHFLALGVLEKFDESILCFAQQLNWSFVRYKVKNVTKGKQRAEISKEDKESIKSNNLYDNKLYEYAKNHLEEKLNNTAFLKLKLAFLKLYNKIV